DKTSFMRNEICIHSFQSVLPPYSKPQNDIVDWIINSHKTFEIIQNRDPMPIEKLRRFALNGSQISRRYYECDEVDEQWEQHKIYKLTKETPYGSSIEERSLEFGRITQRVFSDLYPSHTPSQLIHVTCTGYLSPSPAQ